MANESSTGDYSGFEPVTGDPWYGPVPPDPWYIADGSVIDVDESFRVDMQIPVGLLELLFNERAAQAAPNDRISWRSWFPGSVIPVAMFPCTDPAKTGAVELRDVVDGLMLKSSGSGILYRRLAAGLYASDHRGRFCFNPIRGIELKNAGEYFAAEDEHSLDPPVTAATHNAISGLVIARLKDVYPSVEGIPQPVLLLGKHEEDGKGWTLTMEPTGRIRLTYYDDDGVAQWVEVQARHDTRHWFAALFSAEYWSGEDGVKLRLYTPHGYSDEDHDPPALNVGVSGNQVGAWSPPTEANPVIAAPFELGGAVGQIAFTAYWQGTADKYQLATSNNFHRLWRGTVFPPNVAEEPGMVLKRDQVLGWRVGQTLGGGDVVMKLAPSGAVVSQDPYEEADGERALPHDKDRTNLVEDSEDFGEWTWSSTPPTGPGATGPDGMFTAYEIPKGTTVDASVSSSAGGHVFSVWARSTNGGAAKLKVGGESGDEIGLTRRWSRIAFSCTAVASPTLRIEASGTTGSSIQVWGAQFETGNDPSAYIPTVGGTVTATFTDCKADWTVLPGPPADHGKVQVILTAKQELVDDIGESYAAFEFGYGVDTFLRVWGAVSSDGDEKRFITWNAGGQLWDGGPGHWTMTEIEAEPLEFEEGQPLTVALAWNRRGIELWVEGKLVGRAGPPSLHPEYPVRFQEAPVRCDLMRDGDPHVNWIGACKELRWWR